MPIEVIERGPDGAYVSVPDPGGSSPSGGDAQPTGTELPAETAPGSTPGPQEGSAPQTQDTPPPAEASLAASPEAEGEDADVPDDAATVPFVNRRIKQLNAKRRETEKLLAEERSQNALRQAQLEARLDTLTKVLSGSAPDVPASPMQPTGPPQSEQYADHDTYLDARSTWNAQQVLQQERQQQQQLRFQQDLMSREETFKQAHPDFDTVVRTGLAGKVSPVLNQALMLIPDGPAVAYTLAKQPELVQRLNSLPPPLVLVELGRLSTAPQPTSPTPAVGSPTNGNGAVPAAPLPEPMAPVGGGGSMVQPTFSDNMSQAEFERWRSKTSNLPYVRRS
jgi:hypothetical protein